MAAGPTTRDFVDKDNNTVTSLGGQNTLGNYVPGSTAHDISGNPIVVALDSSVQALGSPLASIGDALASILALLTAGILTTDQNGAAFARSIPMTPGAASVAAGRSVEILCSTGGAVVFNMAGGGAHMVMISDSPFTQTFPYAVVGIATAGTTAAATYANLY